MSSPHHKVVRVVKTMAETKANASIANASNASNASPAKRSPPPEPPSLRLYLAFALGVPLAAYFWDWQGYSDLFAWFEAARIETCAPGSCWLPFPTPPLSVADLFGSAMACFGYRKSAEFPKHWLETVVVCTILQFGGTTITGVLIGQPPSWLTSHTAWPALIFMWWLTFFCPYDAWFRLLSHAGAGGDVLRGFLTIGSWFSTGHAVTSWGMDKALTGDHVKATASMATALVTGTVSACGGGVLAADMLGDKWTFKKPPVFSRPSQALQKGMVCSCLYYLLRDPHGVLRATFLGGFLYRWNASAASAAIAKAAAAAAPAAVGKAAGKAAKKAASQAASQAASSEAAALLAERVAANARAVIGLVIFELSLHAHTFPAANLIEKVGGAIAKVFNMTATINPAERRKPQVAPKKASSDVDGDSKKQK